MTLHDLYTMVWCNIQKHLWHHNTILDNELASSKVKYIVIIIYNIHDFSDIV